MPPWEQIDIATNDYTIAIVVPQTLASLSPLTCAHPWRLPRVGRRHRQDASEGGDGPWRPCRAETYPSSRRGAAAAQGHRSKTKTATTVGDREGWRPQESSSLKCATGKLAT